MSPQIPETRSYGHRSGQLTLMMSRGSTKLSLSRALFVLALAFLTSCWSGDAPASPATETEPPLSSPVGAAPTTTTNVINTPDTAPSLQGTQWHLISLNGEQFDDDTIITLEIDEVIDEVMTGALVCNSYGIYATLANDGTIIVGRGTVGERWVMSAAGCTTASLTVEQYNDLSNRYATTLADATSYELEGDTLRLWTPDGRVLVYQRD